MLAGPCAFRQSLLEQRALLRRPDVH
jgi:hypothetical protein